SKDISVNSNELLQQSPDLAQKVAEQNNVIKSLVLQISKLQNSGQEIIEHEQQRIVSNGHIDERRVGKGKVVRIKNKAEINDNEIVKELNRKSSFKNILIFIYGIFLNIFAWLFSLWWFVVILLFLGIYVLLRLLFKIFGRDRD
ncbi:MAG: hypothetical protein LR005_01985, partial [Candidatus Pacebacteria bacterium]|nr:hypothetical protein [Candidatus Paceibacterota bacterium]